MRKNRKIIIAFLFGLLSAIPAMAQDLPKAVACYQSATRAVDIEAYMDCFTPDAVMIDVSRTFTGHGEIRPWAEREVMVDGARSFTTLQILESEPGYAKTEVKWLQWQVHYSYWWNDAGKITKMSLQYAN